MRDNATFDLPGFAPATPPLVEARRSGGSRIKKMSLRQEQLELLAPTDNSGLPIWQRDDNTDLTGLPVWAPA